MIHRIVHEFYARVRQDPVIGPIFEGKIGDQWDIHLERMVDFWSSVLLATGKYSGQPHILHQSLGLEGAHFSRWLALFRETLDELCENEAKKVFIDRALRIAASLQAGCGIYPYAT